ncbi:MAG: hypothetical protein KIT56_06760 [Gammaproteobacteria bacterium]|nr:hypothetical protein [Gammaproteobacteria bacterium]MCW5583567.1 hypothetical protein [Gammaproteobacteria bacterium]
MSAMEPLYRLFRFNSFISSKEMAIIIEAEIFIRIYQELAEIFKMHYKDYFSIMKFDFDRERDMIDDNFIKLIINDLVLSEAYSLEGIAYHIREPEDVIYEIVSGNNTNPSLKLSRKIIELHRSFRSDLYREIISKFVTEHMKANESLPEKIELKR